MKKTLILIAISFAMLNADAQVHFGLKAGVNLSTIGSEKVERFNYRPGFHAGGLAHIHINKHFALQPEIVYSNQGADIDEPSIFKWKLGYVNVPVLAQYMFLDGFRLQTGPQAGILVKATRDDGNVETDIKDNLNSVDFSWVFGASYITKFNLGFDARFNLGISDINENEALVYRNRVFQVGLFYQFNKH